MPSPTELAARFSAIVRAELSDHLGEIRAKNLQPDYAGPVCATHDYIDANLLMLDAFRDVTGREAVPQSKADARAWSEAWAIAKGRAFHPTEAKG